MLTTKKIQLQNTFIICLLIFFWTPSLIACTMTIEQLNQEYYKINQLYIKEKSNYAANKQNYIKEENKYKNDKKVYHESFFILLHNKDLNKKIEQYDQEYNCLHSNIDDTITPLNVISKIFTTENLYIKFFCKTFKKEETDVITKPLNLIKKDCDPRIPDYNNLTNLNPTQKDLLITTFAYFFGLKDYDIKTVMRRYNDLKSQSTFVSNENDQFFLQMIDKILSL